VSNENDPKKPLDKMTPKEFREYSQNLDDKVKKQVERDMAEFQRQGQEEQARRDRDEFAEDVLKLTGVSLEDLRKEYRESADEDFKKKMDEIERLVKKGRQDKAENLLRNSNIQRGAKASKKKKSIFGCAVIAVLILSGLAGIAYGAYEGFAFAIALVW
jgi:hypothetical protein